VEIKLFDGLFPTIKKQSKCVNSHDLKQLDPNKKKENSITNLQKNKKNYYQAL
jgi:hypothetical protein